MIKFMKKSLALYILFCFLSLSLTFLLFVEWKMNVGKRTYSFHLIQITNPILEILFPVAFAVICVILSTIIAFLIANKEYEKIASKLNQQCDPYDYLQHHLPLMKKATKPNPTDLLIQTNSAVGYHAAGDDASAVQIGERLCSLPVQTPVYPIAAMIHLNLCSSYYALGDIPAMVRHMNTAADYLRTCKPDQNSLFALARLADTECLLNIANGNYSAAQLYLHNRLKAKPYPYQQASMHYYLAEIYEKTSRPDLAQEHLQYVAQHGNRLAIAEQARQKLAQIG
ncbi:MAG: hypothetical protein PUB00_03865 [Clostridiales bacterium]|nr:hypothetical protein [Clostridiales bacterium]